MTRSTWTFTSVSTLIFVGAGLFVSSEVQAAEEAEPVGLCQIGGEGLNPPDATVTEMVCAYLCRSTRVNKKLGDVVPPASLLNCKWSGQDKSSDYLIDPSVGTEAASNVDSVDTRPTVSTRTEESTTQGNTVSLVSPTQYTNAAGDRASKKLAAKEKAFSKGGYTKSEVAQLMKLRKLDTKYNVGSRLDSMEGKVSTMLGNDSYEALTKALADVQELEMVLARDGKLTAAEAERLNNSLMQLEAKVGVASGGGLQAKEALVRERFEANKKNLTAAEIKQVQNQLAAFVAKKKEAEQLVACTTAIPSVCENPITDQERAQLLQMLQNTLEFIREKRDAKLTVEQVANNNRAKIKKSAQQGLITAAQKNELLADVNKAVKDHKDKKLSKAEALSAIRKAGGEELIDEAVEKLAVNKCLKAGEKEIGDKCYSAAAIKSLAAQVNSGKMGCDFAGACEAGQKLVKLEQACIFSCEDAAVADSLNAWLAKIELPSKCKSGEREIGGKCWTLNKIREQVYFSKKSNLQCQMKAIVCEEGKAYVEIPGTCEQVCVTPERAKNLNAWWAEFL